MFRKLVPARIRQNRWLRSLMVPDEVALVHGLLRRSRDLPHVLVDVGAHVGSALRPFCEDGWQIWAFEPDARNRAELMASFGNAPNVSIDARALSDTSRRGVPFYGSSESSGISSLHAFHASHTPQGRVDTLTLEQACRELGIEQIGVLKVDVEGHDLAVLRGVPWHTERLRPAVVICEFEERKTRGQGHGFEELAEYLREHGYHMLVSEWYPVRRYGTPHHWRSMHRYPCRLEDAQAYGNLIGCRDEHHAQHLLRRAQQLAPIWRLTSAARERASLVL
ncbi:MAG TPA: FkbM family methyltransferase [Polyangiales bacterium]|nr:FkbM family methyltransferase [Polyangiales bacterium]